MKLSIAVVLLLASVASARHVVPENNIPYGYLINVGIPAADRVRELERQYSGIESRIYNAPPAAAGEIPWQAGLIGSIPPNRENLGGGSLVSSNRVVTAAHNCLDWTNTYVSHFTVVLGTLTVFSGGTRIQSSNIVIHPNYNSALAIANDIAVIYLSTPVATSALIAPVALPSGGELSQNFAGFAGVTSGYGVTENGMLITQYLRRLDVTVISNTQCWQTYTTSLLDHHICTTSTPGSGICTGDSGGPLVVRSNNRPILVGVTSFSGGCGSSLPSGFTRVTSFMNFIQQNL